MADFSDLVAGKLQASITSATTTGVKVTAQEINGSPITFPTGAHRLYLRSRTRTGWTIEKVSVAAGTSQSGSTVTLGTLTRGLSLSDGTDTTGSSSRAYGFNPNDEVYLSVGAHELDNTVFINQVNTLTGTGCIRSSSTSTAVVRFNSVTTAQRTAMSASNGDVVYDSDKNLLYQYIGGDWAAIGDTGTADATDGSAGKVDIASGTEIGAGTANDATSGAPNVIPVSQTVKTSSGAGDENKLPVLGSSGTLAVGFLGTGTANSSTFLRGDGSFNTLVGSKMFGDGSDGAKSISSSENLDPTAIYNYTTFTLDASQTLGVSSVNSPLVILQSSNATVNGTIELDGKGGAGGAGGAGSSSGDGGDGTAGTAGNTIVSGWTTGSGAGGDGSTNGALSENGAGGGGGSSYFSNGTNGSNADTGSNGGAGGTKLDANRAAFLSSLIRSVACGAGGGGGGGGGNDNGDGGAGGAGGGALLWFIGGDLTLGASSIIRARGAAGTAGTEGGSQSDGGSGGGGGGGTIIIVVAGTITDGGVTLQVSGGAGGAATDTGGAGGAGAAGKAIIYSIEDGTIITA